MLSAFCHDRIPEGVGLQSNVSSASMCQFRVPVSAHNVAQLTPSLPPGDLST